jgi:lysine 6-dehydrogenase
VVRNGVPQEVTALSELETVRFSEPLGELEAFHTPAACRRWCTAMRERSAAWSTRRCAYPGHCAHHGIDSRPGLLDTTAVDVKGQQVVPRDVFVRVAGEKLRKASRISLHCVWW